MKIHKLLILVGLMMAASVASAYNKSMYPYTLPSGKQGAALGCIEAKEGMELEPGKWYTNFWVCKKYADEHGIPLVAVWSNEECVHCWWTDIVFIQDDFLEWKENNDAGQVIYCFMAGGYGGYDQENSTAYNWMWYGGGTRLNAYPFVVLWWAKENVNERYTGDNFCGSQDFNERSIPGRVTTVIGRLEKAFANWSPEPAYAGGEFALSDEEGSRLEVVPGQTEWVDVPLVRETGSVGATNYLAVGDSDAAETNLIEWVLGETETVEWATLVTNIEWAVGETSKLVRLEFETAPTKDLALVLCDEAGEFADLSEVICTNRANSISYPYWVGEKTAEELEFGEWTMDMAVAREKAAANNGYVLVNLGGDLWCPDCVSVAETLYADAEFTQWAQDNNVALVSVDVPRTLENEASLLTYTEGGKWSKSGAYYRSSKMIEEAAAEAQLETNWMLATNTYKLASTTGWRVSVPVMVLLKADGTVVGHFMAKEGGADESGVYTYETAENIARLNELLAMVNQPGGQDQEAHKDSSTTTLKHAVGSDTTEMTLQINDNAWFYQLEDVAPGKVMFEVEKADGTPDVTIELFTTSTGTYAEKKMLAQDTNTLSYVVSDEVAQTNVYLRVGTYPNATGSDTRGKDTYTFAEASSLFNVKVTSKVIFTPSEIEYTLDLDEGADPTSTAIYLELKAGTVYKMTGFSADSLANYFTAGEGGLYTANEDAEDAALYFDANSTQVAYQIWKPGTVQFMKAKQSWLETMVTGTVTVARSGGKAGAAKVKVVVDEEATTAGERYKLLSNELTWDEGETGEKSIQFEIIQNPDFEGLEYLVLKLEEGSGNAAELGKTVVQTNAIFDTMDPDFGARSYDYTFYTGFSRTETYPLYNIRENKNVKLVKVSGTLPTGITMTYDKATTSVVMKVNAKKAAEETEVVYKLTEEYTENGKKDTATGLDTTFKITILDPKALTTKVGDTEEPLNPYIGVAQKNVLVPVYGTDEDVEDVGLAGTLRVNVSAANMVTAKFTSSLKKVLSFSGRWQDMDQETGDVWAELTARTGETLKIVMSRDGALSGTIEDADCLFGDELTLMKTAPIDTERLANYAGTYTVTFPIKGGITMEDTVGTGYLTLTAKSKTFLRKGTVSYSGLAMNGQAIRGTSTLIPDAYTDENTGLKYAVVPIFCRMSTGVFAAQVIVREDGWTDMEATPYDTTVDPQLVLAYPGVAPYFYLARTEEVAELECYGGALLPKASVYKMLETRQNTHEFVASFNNAKLTGESDYEGVKELACVTLENVGEDFEAWSSSMKIYFTKKTGILTGRVTVEMESGRRVNGTFRGVYLPGWYECMSCSPSSTMIVRPVVSGMVIFTDRRERKSVKRTFAVDFNVED